MRFFLKRNFVFVKGQRGGAIYDLMGGRVYSVDPKAAIKLEREKQDNDFWQVLVDEGLAIKSDNKPEEVVKAPIPKLKFAWLEVNKNCNFKCIHCYGGWNNENMGAKSKKIDWYGVIDYLKFKKCQKVQFIGGEPLLFPDLKPLIKYTREKGISAIEVFTNGSLLDDEWVKFFKQWEIDLAISLHSVSENIFKKITQSKTHPNQVLKNIAKVKAQGMKVRVATVVMKQNQDELDKIQKLSPVKNLRFDIVRPANNLNMDSLLPRKRVRARLAFFNRPTAFTNKKDFCKNMYFNSCWMGRIAITADGDIIPCIFARTCVAGNILKGDMEKAYVTLVNKFWKLNLDNVEKCGSCEFRYACKNCRPLSMGYYGRLKGPNPYCNRG